MKSPGMLATPRPEPGHLLPALAGSVVILFALPLFLILDWDMTAWVLAALLWAGIHALKLICGAQGRSTGNLAASGMQAFGLLFKTLGLLVVLFAVAASTRISRWLAALLYALAYTLELGLSMVSLLRRRAMKSRLLAVVLFALAFPQAAFARGEFDPSRSSSNTSGFRFILAPLIYRSRRLSST